MDNSFGERIRRFRKIADLTQEELAEECEVSISTISRWEQGTLFPRGGHLEVLSKVFKVSLGDLLETSSPDDFLLVEFRILLEKLTVSERKYFLDCIQEYLRMKANSFEGK